MILAVTTGHALARAGLVVDAVLAAQALLARGALRRAAIAAALVLTPILLGAELWRSTQVVHLRHHPALAAVAIVAAIAVVAALALAFRGRPALFALAAVVALPFRFSVLAGGTGGILIPLYAVIAGGALADVTRSRDPGGPAPGWLERALAAFVVLYALQATYTPAASLAKAVEDAGFFLVPFSLLYALARRVPWDRALIRRCGLAVVALSLAFAAVGAVEYASRRLVFNTALNANQRFFRINSLFYDPNIFGRFLALTMVLVVAAMLWESDRRRVGAAGAVLIALWFALLGTLSLSSMVALLAGLAVIGAARFPVRLAAAATAAVVAAGVIIAIAASGRLHLNLSDTSAANNATSDRASLVQQGVDLYVDRPLAGFGAGSFSCEYLRHTGRDCSSGDRTLSESHTIPITIAAEQGTVGLIAYVLLLAAALWRLAAGGLRRDPARVAILAAFVALVIHTWAYADFLEDPIAWLLLAAGAALAARAHGEPG